MRTNLGPGGTAGCELDGIGLNWYQRPTAEGVPVYFWTGSWPGQYSGLLFVPDRGFALALLTNSDSAVPLRGDLTVFGDWVLDRFAGLHNPPAVPQTLTAAQLAPYEGRYTGEVIDPPPGDSAESVYVIRAADGVLRMSAGNINPELAQESLNTGPSAPMAFYRDNYVVFVDANGQPTSSRANFITGPNGDIAWFSLGGTLYRHVN